MEGLEWGHQGYARYGGDTGRGKAASGDNGRTDVADGLMVVCFMF